MLGQKRFAQVTCIVLVQDDFFHRELSSVSIKLHGGTILSSPVETVTVRTQRQAALWQDANLWENDGNIWRLPEPDDTRFHLLDVFTMAQHFCNTGVSDHCCLSPVDTPHPESETYWCC